MLQGLVVDALDLVPAEVQRLQRGEAAEGAPADGRQLVPTQVSGFLGITNVL